MTFKGLEAVTLLVFWPFYGLGEAHPVELGVCSQCFHLAVTFALGKKKVYYIPKSQNCSESFLVGENRRRYSARTPTSKTISFCLQLKQSYVFLELQLFWYALGIFYINFLNHSETPVVTIVKAVVRTVENQVSLLVNVKTVFDIGDLEGCDLHLQRNTGTRNDRPC